MNEKKIRESIARQLSKRRKEVGKSLSQIERETGITRQFVSSVEKGETNIQAWRLAILAKALGRSINYFIV